MLFTHYIDSPLGLMQITCSHEAILSCEFIEKATLKPSKKLLPKIAKDCELQIQQYFQGKRKSFELALKPTGTDFQKAVWLELTKLPYGKISTYGKIAAQIGDVKKTRAVATAIAKNPIAIIIPCHRVIGLNGEMRGFAWGIDRKKALLKLEGAGINLPLF